MYKVDSDDTIIDICNCLTNTSHYGSLGHPVHGNQTKAIYYVFGLRNRLSASQTNSVQKILLPTKSDSQKTN